MGHDEEWAELTDHDTGRTTEPPERARQHILPFPATELPYNRRSVLESPHVASREIGDEQPEGTWSPALHMVEDTHHAKGSPFLHWIIGSSIAWVLIFAAIRVLVWIATG